MVFLKSNWFFSDIFLLFHSNQFYFHLSLYFLFHHLSILLRVRRIYQREEIFPLLNISLLEMILSLACHVIYHFIPFFPLCKYVNILKILPFYIFSSDSCLTWVNKSRFSLGLNLFSWGIVLLYLNSLCDFFLKIRWYSHLNIMNYRYNFFKFAVKYFDHLDKVYVEFLVYARPCTLGRYMWTR